MYWYEDEVKRLEMQHTKLKYEAETLFYGSSSFRLWETLYEDFEVLKPVNLGFGGSTLAACVWFFDRIMKPYHPKRMIIYAGDNDLGDGRHPEEVFIFFQQLYEKVFTRFGDLHCYFLSLKPSLNRWHMMDQFRYTNNLIKADIERHKSHWHFVDMFTPMLDGEGKLKHEYFVSDGLHLSEHGYLLWKNVLNSQLSFELQSLVNR